MFPVPDALAALYLTCFAVGLIFVVASLLMGLTHDTLHLPGLEHGHAGAHAAAGSHLGDASGGHGHLHTGGVSNDNIHPTGHEGLDGAGEGGEERVLGHHHVSPVNVSTVMAFLTWFGGAGYIMHVYAGVLGFLSLVVAAVAGLAGGALIFYFLAKVLLPGQRFLDPADYRTIGTVARVTVPMEADRVGEVVYAQGGSRHSDGARSADGSPIERDAEVVIVRYEHGIAYVEPWSSYVMKG